MKRRKRWLTILSIAVLLMVTMLGGIVSALAGEEQAVENVQGTAIGGETGDGTTEVTYDPHDEPGDGGDVGGQEAPEPQGEESSPGDLTISCHPEPKKGKICVIKFLDLDKNGKKDAGESGMPGVTIKLDGGNLKTTGSDGQVCYEGLGEGRYTVSEVVPAGYSATTDTSYTVEIKKRYSTSCFCPTPSCTYDTVTVFFGNAPIKPPKPGSISGHKYHDLDGDGVLDPGEPGLENWTIELWQGSTKITRKTKGGDGSYSFTGLKPGTYTVKEVLTSAWQATNPADGSHDNIVVAEGQNVTGIDFLNKKKLCRQGKVEVLVYEDTNCSGVLDGGDELTTMAVEIEIYHYIDGGLVPADGWDGPHSKPTGAGPSWWPVYANGCASWQTLPCRDIPPGTCIYGDYVVKMIVPDGWTALEVDWAGRTYTTEFGIFHLQCIFGLPTCTWQQIKFLLGRVCPPTFHISGHKYEDLDGDGVKDPGEPGLENWTIELWQGSTKVDQTTTDINGYYIFDNLPHGIYDVKEVLKAGWSPTSPDDGVHEAVAVGCGDNAENVDFLNYEYASIRGIKFIDLDDDGVMDIDEEGLDGVTIILNPGGLTTVTASGGLFSFENLMPGNYTVAVDESSVPGYYPTTLTSFPVELESGETETVAFGNAPYGSISGHKWLDADLDGVWDAGETVTIPGVTIKLYEGDPPVGDPIATMDTGPDGSYAFPNLEAGTYTLVEEAEDGYFPTTPTTFVVELSPGEGEVVDFGNCPYSRIDGFKFEDLDGDGVQDEGEEGMEGVEITLVGLDYTETAYSGEDGTFSFEDLVPGDYTVSETLPAGYYATSPISVDIELKPGDEASVIFSNAPYGSISGTKWLDANRNGAIDDADTPLAGVTIKLEGETLDGELVSFTKTTAGDGTYSFLLLEAGDYKVSEEFDTTKYYSVFDTSMDVELSPGEDRDKIDFLNADAPVGGEVVTPPVVAGEILAATGMEQLPLLLLAAGFILAGLVLLALGLRRRYGRQAV